ncbi:MAG: flagellar biosynthesis protein FliQ [Pseudomonadota bacterium]
MTGPEVLDIGRDAVTTMLVMAAPIMMVGLGVGLVIALFQALTQIQEMTLAFVPKILAMFVALIVTLPFMGRALGGYMERIADQIINI